MTLVAFLAVWTLVSFILGPVVGRWLARLQEGQR